MSQPTFHHHVGEILQLICFDFGSTAPIAIRSRAGVFYDVFHETKVVDVIQLRVTQEYIPVKEALVRRRSQYLGELLNHSAGKVIFETQHATSDKPFADYEWSPQESCKETLLPDFEYLTNNWISIDDWLKLGFHEHRLQLQATTYPGFIKDRIEKRKKIKALVKKAFEDRGLDTTVFGKY